MSFIVFDTETTGFRPGSICQLSYIIDENGNCRGKNFYFMVDYIEPGASMVNGLTVDSLARLSCRRKFHDNCEEILNDFQGADMLAAHNFNFDINFLRTEFMRCGFSFRYKRSFCTMKNFTNICRLPSRNGYPGYKAPKLEELVNHFHISQGEIVKFTEKIFNGNAARFHDARYDTAATYLCLVKEPSGIYLKQA